MNTSLKIISAKEAVKVLKSNDNLAMSMHFSQPKLLLEAIDEYVNQNNLNNVNAYYFSSRKFAADSILRIENNKKIIPNSFFFSATERGLRKEAKAQNLKINLNFVPCHFSQATKVLGQIVPIDVFVSSCTKPDKDGYVNLGISNDYTTTLLEKAKYVILEINENMPWVQGEKNTVHVSKVHALVENNVPLLQVSDQEVEPSAEEIQIAKNVSELIPNCATIQMGVGSVPNLIAKGLVNHKDLGIHTEVLTTGMIDLIEKGVVTNKYKKLLPNKTVFTFCLGNKKMYDMLNNNPNFYSAPVHFVNDELNISKNDNVISINSTVEIDLLGQCNSEFILGQQFSATGGQVDFVRGAYRSKNGKSIIALASSAKKSTISKIVPKLSGPATTLRNDVHWVVTEHGAVNLKGLTTKQRAEALISISHPNFRVQLTEEAKKLGYI